MYKQKQKCYFFYCKCPFNQQSDSNEKKIVYYVPFIWKIILPIRPISDISWLKQCIHHRGRRGAFLKIYTFVQILSCIYMIWATLYNIHFVANYFSLLLRIFGLIFFYIYRIYDNKNILRNRNKKNHNIQHWQKLSELCTTLM